MVRMPCVGSEMTLAPGTSREKKKEKKIKKNRERNVL